MTSQAGRVCQDAALLTAILAALHSQLLISRNAAHELGYE